MKKEKLKIEKLNVKSFTTNNQASVKGGWFPTEPELCLLTIYVTNCNGKHCM